MKNKLLAIAAVAMVSGCAGMNPHQTRGDLAAAPGAVKVVQLNKPPAAAYSALAEMMRSCVESNLLRTSGEKPGADGRGGVLSVSSISTMLVSGRVWETAILDPALAGGTQATIYSATNSEQLDLAGKFARWANAGDKRCSE